MRLSRSVLAVAAAGALTAGGLVSTIATAPVAAAKGMSYQQLNPIQKRLASGMLTDALGGARPAAVTPQRYQPTAGNGCAQSRGGNVQVNQNCLNVSDTDLQGRSQAQNETWVAADPNNPKHLVATYNDYRRGDGTCGASFTLDGGKTWNDSTVPNGFTRGTAFGNARQYWQAGGDTSVAWDTHGNAYLSCQLFNRGSSTSPNPDQSSAFYVFRSTGNAGASWNFTGRAAAEFSDTAGQGGALLDKQLLTVDNHPGSKYRDRIYVTYTSFTRDGTGYIYSVHSDNYGESFSAPVLVSRNSNLCTNTFGLPTPHGTCNENQFSDPFTAPNGTLYVTWANFNNNVNADQPPGGDANNGQRAAASKENYNQMLIAKSSNGGGSFAAPVRVGKYYDLPDCATYEGGQDLGRSCVPEKGRSQHSFFRATNYPVGAVSPNGRRVVVTYGSYINQHSKESLGCRPAGFSATTGANLYDGVKNGGCNNDILISQSADGGRSYTGTHVDPRRMPVVTTAPGQAKTDQFWQGAAFTAKGTLAVTYYDRAYGNDERTGFSDITLSGSSDYSTFGSRRVTTSSMPPPTEFSGLFYGDYIAVATAGERAFPIWSDTRATDLFLCPGSGQPGVPPQICAAAAPNASLANDQEIYTQGIAVPTGAIS